MSARSVRTGHVRYLPSGRRADMPRISDLVLADAGVAMLGGFCLILASGALSDIAGL
jgi:hypothetical protein